MNKILLIGRMTREPEIKHIEEIDKTRCNFTIAVNRRVKNSEGIFEADFIPVVVWGKIAENVGKYMQKGSLISVIGRLQIRSYTDKDNNKRFAAEVVGEEVQFLERKKEAIS
ncbi:MULTISPECIES: single-stranded DNA-binding protein [Clostridium]|uniref:single-stranded DNA-binding protein n=1 Tax=Clostridium TaxID=1485 RepID=UPI00069DA4B9|nr:MULTISPECIES: single-stranded DNA-binding protein [Clostridium]KOF56903.1 single-stranded DNA-binding protein [Clostridium sp. DMHC 10]MCD2347336.1 single-stranded DNA-binding protein [Clostridium guangxiense]